MNFLAHLYLSRPEPAAWIGNLLPDLCRARAIAALSSAPAELLEGVRNHRRVDAFTDTHPLFHRSRQRLFPYHGRFSGILVDMLYDHALAQAWRRYHPDPLPVFVQRVYAGIREHRDLAPPPARPVLDHLCDQDWLSSYATRNGMRLSLTRMSVRFSHRFGREIDLASAVDRLDEHGEALQTDFHTFFPLLIRHVGQGLLPANAAVW